MKKSNETVSNEELARMIADGFAQMATKDDIAHMATKDDIANMATKDDIANMATKDDIAHLEARLDHMDARQGMIELDIGEIKRDMVRRYEFDDALSRIKYAEKKLNTESGK